MVHCEVSDRRGGLTRKQVIVRVGSPTTLRISGRVTRLGQPVVGARVYYAVFTDSNWDKLFHF